MLNGAGDKSGEFNGLSGDLHLIRGIEFVDQNPIGKSSRSNPVTYIKAFDEIRKLYASQQLSKYNRFTPSHFSFNIDGGRCEECQGKEKLRWKCNSWPMFHLVCDSCHGKRFKDDVLEVNFEGKNIFDIWSLLLMRPLHSLNLKREARKSYCTKTFPACGCPVRAI